jgi:hypothetical protein
MMMMMMMREDCCSVQVLYQYGKIVGVRLISYPHKLKRELRVLVLSVFVVFVLCAFFGGAAIDHACVWWFAVSQTYVGLGIKDLVQGLRDHLVIPPTNLEFWRGPSVSSFVLYFYR